MDFEAFLLHEPDPKFNNSCYLDTAEICGGNARTTQILIRRHYDTGENFDAVVGCDLMLDEDADALFHYLDTQKPIVTIISTPCTGMAGWRTVNEVNQSQRHEESVYISSRLGTLGAMVALRQMRSGSEMGFALIR